VLTKPGPTRDFKDGVTKCSGSKPGETVVETWKSPASTKGTVVPASAADGILLENGELITIAFIPKGTTIPRPPAADVAAIKTFLLEDPAGVVTTTLPATTSTSSTTTTTVAKKKKKSASSSTTSSTS